MADTSQRKFIPDVLCPTCLGLLVLVFTILSGRHMTALYENGFCRATQDMASINQAVWNTAHGAPLQATILYEGFRDHMEPALVFYSLNYLLGGTIVSLFYLHSFMIALGSVPIYFMGRRRGLGTAEALAFTLPYFLLPPIWGMVQSSYLRPDLLFFPVLTLMAYAVVFSKRTLLIASCALTICCKESGSLIVAGLGLYLLIFKRDWKLGLLILVAGAAYLPVTNYLVLPRLMCFRPRHSNRIKELSAGHLANICALEWPVAVAAILVVLLVARRWQATISLPHSIGLLFFRARYRYVLPIIPIPFFLLLHMAAGSRNRWVRRIFLAVLCVLFVVLDVERGYWRVKLPVLEPRRHHEMAYRYRRAYDIPRARPLMDLIPPDASVCASSELLVHLSGRKKIYQFNRHHYFSWTGRDYLDAEYFILPSHGKTWNTRKVRRHPRFSEAFREFEELDTEIIAESAPYTLYRRKRRTSQKLPLTPGKEDRLRQKIRAKD